MSNANRIQGLRLSASTERVVFGHEEEDPRTTEKGLLGSCVQVPPRSRRHEKESPRIGFEPTRVGSNPWLEAVFAVLSKVIGSNRMGGPNMEGFPKPGGNPGDRTVY